MEVVLACAGIVVCIALLPCLIAGFINAMMYH